MSIIGATSKILDPVTEAAQTSAAELDHFHDIDPDRIFFDVLKSKRLDINVRAAVTDGAVEDSIDATPNVTLNIHDPDWELLDSGALSKKIDVKIGKRRWYRLSTVEVTDYDLTCTFIIRNAAILMQHNKRRKVTRNKATRAEFIQMLVKSVKKVKIKFFSKQLHKKQKVEPLRINRDGSRQRGLPDKTVSEITVKGEEADSEQRKNIEQVLDECQEMNAPRRAMVGAIMCIIQEAVARRSATAGQFVGLFQQSSRYGWPATRDPRKDAHAFLEKFIPLVKQNPRGDLGALIAKVQRPLHPDEFALGANRWRDEAETAVDQYVGESGLTTREYRKRYEFETLENEDGTNENYLAAIYRLADQVNWRAYWVINDLHFDSEEDLFRARPRYRFERADEEIEGISFTINEQRKALSMTLRVRMNKWFCPVGTVVVFGPKLRGKSKRRKERIKDNPANGKWLVTNIRRGIFNELGEITLSKPIKETLEPAPTIATRQIDDGSSRTDRFGNPFGGSFLIDDSEGARSIVESLSLIAGAPAGTVTPGGGIRVISDYRENSTTRGGTISDHSQNNESKAARDIGFGSVDALTGPPPRQLDEAMKRIADALGWEYTPGDVVNWREIPNWKNTGIRIQVGWRVQDHFGHIHVGARTTGIPPHIRPGAGGA